MDGCYIDMLFKFDIFVNMNFCNALLYFFDTRPIEFLWPKRLDLLKLVKTSQSYSRSNGSFSWRIVVTTVFIIYTSSLRPFYQLDPCIFIKPKSMWR